MKKYSPKSVAALLLSVGALTTYCGTALAIETEASTEVSPTPSISITASSPASSDKAELRKQKLEQLKEEAAKKQEALKALREKQTEDRKQELEKLKELRVKATEKRQEFQKKLTEIKDEKKKQATERIDSQLAKINEQMTGQYLKHVETLEHILAKIASRTDKAKTAGKDVATVEAAIDAAQASLDTLKTDIATQQAKDYTVTIVGEDKLRESFRTVHEQMKSDHRILRNKIKAARESIKDVFMLLKGLVGSSDEATATASPSVSPASSATPTVSPSVSASISPSPEEQ